MSRNARKPKPFHGWALVRDGRFIGHMVYVDVHATRRGATIEAKGCDGDVRVIPVRVVPAPKGGKP